MKAIVGKFVPLAMLFLATPAAAQDWHLWPRANWQYAVGFDYSDGRYGAALDTSVLRIPATGRFQIDRLRLEATLPYLEVEGPGVFTGSVVVGGTGTASIRRKGIGDLELGAAWLADEDDALHPAIEFEGFVKLPTAKRGLGTRKADFSAQINLYHSLSSRLRLFGTLGYQWLNNFQTYMLRDGVLAKAGADYEASSATSLGVSISYRQEYYGGLGDLLTVSPYILWNFSGKWHLSAYALAGATGASPSYGLGMRLIFAA